MKVVSFNLGLRKYIPHLGDKFLVIDSVDGRKVTVHRTSILDECKLEGGNLVYDRVFLSNTHLGIGSYVNSGTTLRDVYVGAYSSVSSNVKIINGRHPSGFVSTYPGFYSNIHEGIITYADSVYFNEFAERNYFNDYVTYIGNDVLIGSGAVLMEGVKIDDGAIVLPYSVVTKDVEPYSVVGGIPADVIKYRFEEKDRELLLKSQWWEKDYNYFRDNWKMMLDIKEFIKNYEFED